MGRLLLCIYLTQIWYNLIIPLLPHVCVGGLTIPFFFECQESCLKYEVGLITQTTENYKKNTFIYFSDFLKRD